MLRFRKQFHNLTSRQRRSRIWFDRYYYEQVVTPVEVAPSSSSRKVQLSASSTRDQVPLHQVQDCTLGDQLNNEPAHDESFRNASSSDNSMDSDLDSEVELSDRTDQFRSQLANAFLETDVNHIQANRILQVIRSHACLAYLPKDARTLLKTPANTVANIVDVAPGQYLHVGVASAIQNKLNFLPIHDIPSTLWIDLSTDGGQLDSAGTVQFWPLQLRIVNIPNDKPTIVGVYKGNKKPSNPHDFLKPFIEEFLDITFKGGVDVQNTRIVVKIRCFIADSPARAFILNHRGHTSAYPCSKCKVVGMHVARRMVFPGINQPLRTNAEYRACLDENHHRGESPLSLLAIGLVSQVPCEYMHSVCLGVTKKLLEAWCEGKYAARKLSARSIAILDSRSAVMQTCTPREFARRTAAISSFRRYKATEFRQFLLYTGPAILSGVLEENAFIHFLLLHFAIRILTSLSPSPEAIDFAENALQQFVENAERLYGVEFMSFNTHSLLHLANDVRSFGPLDSFSAFAYENHMPFFRKYIRKPHLPLQQFSKRLAELNSSTVPVSHSDNVTEIRVSGGHVNGPLSENFPVNTSQFKLLTKGTTTFGSNRRDKCCILKDSSIAVIRNIILSARNEYVFLIQKFTNTENLYDIGMPSSSVGLFRCSQLSPFLSVVSLNDISGKCFCMPTWSNIEPDSTVNGVLVCATMHN